MAGPGQQAALGADTGEPRVTPARFLALVAFTTLALVGIVMILAREPRGILVGIVISVVGIIGVAKVRVRRSERMSMSEVGQPTVVRSYRGRQQAATGKYQADAVALARYGYRPVSQSWAPGQYRPADFIGAVFLCLFLIGFLIFVAMVLVKPAGTLTVTYGLLEPSALLGSAAQQGSLGLNGALVQLAQARDAGLVSQQEFDAKRSEVLARI